MDIKQRLRERIEKWGDLPVTNEPHRELARDALAEIERLEGAQRATEEFQSTVGSMRAEIERLKVEARVERSLKNQARADLVKCADKLNAYTDRMITAGLMS
jgi:adenine-specific DNA methylase